MNNADKRKALSDKITERNLKIEQLLKKIERLRLDNVRDNNKINSLR